MTDPLPRDTETMDHIVPAHQAISGSTPADITTLLQVRMPCLFCAQVVETVTACDQKEVTCGACGKEFRIDAEATQSWAPDKLRTIGRFKLLAVVGRGAFGVVYRAHDTTLDRVVALKAPRRGVFDTPEDFTLATKLWNDLLQRKPTLEVQLALMRFWLETVIPSERDPQAARELAAQASHDALEHPLILGLRGAAECRSGDWEAALKFLARAARLAPADDCRVGFYLAWALAKTDRRDAAQAQFDRAEELRQQHRAGNAELQRLHAEIARELATSTGTDRRE